MAVSIGSYDAILSGAVGGDGSNAPLPSFTEVLTEGHWDGLDIDDGLGILREDLILQYPQEIGPAGNQFGLAFAL